MGSCLCKEDKNEDENAELGRPTASSRGIHNTQVFPRVVCGVDRFEKKSLSETVDKLVNETLDVIGTIIDNEPEPPNSILMLHTITEKPAGWIELVGSLMRMVPMEHPMGPSVIAILLDDSPLPTRDSVMMVADMISPSLRCSPSKERNLCVILGCLAEKLAGPSSIALLTESTLNYLINNIVEAVDENVTLLSLIALEKFAQTSENKTTIKKTLMEAEVNPLTELEKYATTHDFLRRQIGFCARWCLDNYFTIPGRKYSHETTDYRGINAMLNTRDVSEYLKISPDGLEARCDTYTFESVRCTFQVSSGSWYYEVLLITPGVMQIGWATKESSFLNDDGYGTGDDKYSIGFDGCRRLIWYNAKSVPHNLPVWKSGTVLGCLLDLDKQEVLFSLDGHMTDPYRHVFSSVREGFFAAASFMSYQQCRFNFGLEPFLHAPNRPFKSFNDSGTIKEMDKTVLPRHIYLELLRKVSVRDDSCTLCFDRTAVIRLEPCHHRGFCVTCVQQLKLCPMCRADIKERLKESLESLDREDPSSSDIYKYNSITIT